MQDLNRNSTDEGLQELIDSLKELSKAMSSTAKVLRAQVKVNEGKFKDVQTALLQQSIEDGIISNLHVANETQLRRILAKENRYFKYYDEAYKEVEFFQIKG